MVPVGTVIAVLEVDSGAGTGEAADESTDSRPPAPAFSGVHASPFAMSIAEERGVDLSKVRGTGRAGRITKEDVLAHIAEHGEEPAPSRSWEDSSEGEDAGDTSAEPADLDDALEESQRLTVPPRTIPGRMKLCRPSMPPPQ